MRNAGFAAFLVDPSFTSLSSGSDEDYEKWWSSREMVEFTINEWHRMTSTLRYPSSSFWHPTSKSESPSRTDMRSLCSSPK
ncbi:unnamed protein product [Caenorhabditis sp. 36 PRJEB53466]|nr:unnamed protein product [Caenorhabditis sp. 36 PRJEB53466]